MDCLRSFFFLLLVNGLAEESLVDLSGSVFFQCLCLSEEFFLGQI